MSSPTSLAAGPQKLWRSRDYRNADVRSRVRGVFKASAWIPNFRKSSLYTVAALVLVVFAAAGTMPKELIEDHGIPQADHVAPHPSLAAIVAQPAELSLPVPQGGVESFRDEDEVHGEKETAWLKFSLKKESWKTLYLAPWWKTMFLVPSSTSAASSEKSETHVSMVLEYLEKWTVPRVCDPCNYPSTVYLRVDPRNRVPIVSYKFVIEELKKSDKLAGTDIDRSLVDESLFQSLAESGILMIDETTVIGDHIKQGPTLWIGLPPRRLPYPLGCAFKLSFISFFELISEHSFSIILCIVLYRALNALCGGR
jgi:hypothetical protein